MAMEERGTHVCEGRGRAPFFVVLGLGVLVSGLASAGPGGSGTIQLEAREDGRWEATYAHPDGVEGLRFSRPARFLRENAWRVETEGYTLARDGDSQVVHLEGGQAARQALVISAAVDTRFISRDYEFFNTFTDGGVAVFLGAYLAESLSGDVVFDTFEITPPPGHHVVVDGERTTGRTVWVDAAMHGTYAYVGTQTPVAGSSSVTIVDPGLADWIGSTAQARIDRIIEAFTVRLEASSPRPAFVLLSYEPGSAAGYSFNGGTRDDLVQLRLQGEDWNSSSPEADKRLMRFIAHEVAHLWNGQLARPVDGEPPWMHEGSADALADLVLAELGVLDAGEVSHGLEQALNRCHGALRGGGTLERAWNPQVHYACGHVVSNWTHLEMLAAGHPGGLFDFWAGLIRRPGREAGGYSRSDYFSVLESMGVDNDAVAAMRQFVDMPIDSPAQYVADRWQRHGVTVERQDAVASESMLVEAASAVVMALLERDCGAEHGFYTQGATLEFGGLGACSTARNGFQVTHIDDVALDAPMFAAVSRARAQCESTQKLRLSGAQGSIELQCPEQMPDAPGWWTIAR